MGRVDAFRIAGLDLWFNSDDHLPPHFHAEKSGDWEVKVHLMRTRDKMIEVVWKRKKVPKAALNDLCRAAELHRASLLQEWAAKVNVKTPGEKE